ncbi:MAG: N-formylglutamate amidohydrolase [Sphingomonadales bacterium]|nr:N-formylglutamate amidohydrolase [Sphingomonadales bacterium]MDE2169496.1 N-formylglutamate amidohydrolase [Sphingomonadales bacterium]
MAALAGCIGEPFVTRIHHPSRVPVLVSVPHGGRAYDPALMAGLREGERAALRLEDRLIDEVAGEVAAATGAGLVVARAPRAMLDLNRAPDDVDWAMIPDATRGCAMAAILSTGGHARPHGHPSQRVRAGLGLVPRRVPGLGELWRQPLSGEVLAQRLHLLHAPYHACIADQLARLRARWGTALLIDLHSMPPLPREEGQAPITCVIGDRFGASCGGMLVARAYSQLSDSGWLVAHNRPYAGGYVLDRHANPRGGIHAMQLEIDRAAYLDSRLVAPGAGFAEVVGILASLVRDLASEVASIGVPQSIIRPQDWAEAAE